MAKYSQEILELITRHPLKIDTTVQLGGRIPSSASSDFQIHKAQGDWAERLVMDSINAASPDYMAVHYGRSDSILAGEPGFEEFYAEYIQELNAIGKKPDILLFRRNDVPSSGIIDFNDETFLAKAIAAFEVRSSSFLSAKYMQYMEQRSVLAHKKCFELRHHVLQKPYGSILKSKAPDIWSFLRSATEKTFDEFDFRPRSWHSSPELRYISECLKGIRKNIALLHERDSLSITPKLEDLALVNRWIQRFNIPFFYLQVFFDCGYIIPFKTILELTSNPDLENDVFTLESDIKNQGKTTLKVNISHARLLLSEITMPNHRSVMKELSRGRVMFYVNFSGGEGHVDMSLLRKIMEGESL